MLYVLADENYHTQLAYIMHVMFTLVYSVLGQYFIKIMIGKFNVENIVSIFCYSYAVKN